MHTLHSLAAFNKPCQNNSNLKKKAAIKKAFFFKWLEIFVNKISGFFEGVIDIEIFN